MVVARSLKMRALLARLEAIAASKITVLIEGETGTGKELIARAIHAASPCADGPFVIFDCGAVGARLAAEELFGHERGAFTGADRARTGLFEQACGGTLFVDEVAEMPLDLQPLLLRVLERRSIRRLGSDHDRPCDVRLIVATTRDLATEVRERRFRKDLYYRLAVARVAVPPLRERREDVPLLAADFAAECGAELTPELLAMLTRHSWPGNVRELRNAIARLAICPSASVLDPPPRNALLPLSEARRRATDAFERSYLEVALAETQGNIGRAAELAGVSRQLLTRLLARHGLRARDRRRA